MLFRRFDGPLVVTTTVNRRLLYPHGFSPPLPIRTSTRSGSQFLARGCVSSVAIADPRASSCRLFPMRFKF